ncbi:MULTISPECIES: D-amino-acid transaminase [Inquilinus]|uniref:Probable branched-chain-amino-acid aminotransferase n=1 Tax=Inquilinus ginsengisoli TaxID=363840 RepID=A0ABU1JWK7_9PROT|nr:D-amino-acid transaminase [Inquilinus ginsengisoli]MDR6293001.1 D-alanine transaminase [Inquilinus ginsengisoli]
MARDAYVNGRYVPHAQAAVHVEDRGFQFADGVYEVVCIRNGRLIDEDGHLDRLDRCLGELRIAWPCERRVMRLIMRRLIGRNGVRNGLIYLQVTRGTAARDFRFPAAARPTLVMTTRRAALAANARAGVRVITIPDIRWKRCDLKTVGLLAQVLGKQEAAERGAFEAWQVDEDGFVTEGTSSNAWILTADGALVTRPASHDILNGITRQSILRIAAAEGVRFEERPFDLDEAYAAREAFVSSATSFVTPVVRIDDRAVGDGTPGALGRRLLEAYVAHAEGAGAS